MMSDEEEEELSRSNVSGQVDDESHRRLSEIKSQLQAVIREKKKYDEEKLKQNLEFYQNEINASRASIVEINKNINNQTQIKKRLQIQMTNLRSRSRLHYTNLATALRDKRKFEAQLKKKDRTEEYQALVLREIRSIDEALPILREEDELRNRVRMAEEAQQTVYTKRRNLEESLNNFVRKKAETEQQLSEYAEKLPQFEAQIESLRSERQRLLARTASVSSGGKKSRRRHLQHNFVNSPMKDTQTPTRAPASFENEFLTHEKTQSDEQLLKIDTLLNYLRNKLAEHDLQNEQPCVTPSSELTSFLYQPLTPSEEQTILSSYMEDQDTENTLLSKTNTEQPTAAIAMKLPRNFLPLNLNATTTNEIIHSPYYDAAKVEYKKELSSDIISKYGGQPKKGKQNNSSSTGKRQKKQRKNFAITHVPQMIALYDSVRSSTGSSETMPSMPMYEYELIPAIRSLEFLKQNLESYLTDLSRYCQNRLTSSNEDEQQSRSEVENGEDEVRDSALDTFSEGSSFIEPMNAANQFATPKSNLMNILEVRSSASSDSKKTKNSSASSNHSESKQESRNDTEAMLAKVEELNSELLPLTIQNNQIDRQISDEGYRSVLNEQRQLKSASETSSQSPPSLVTSASFNSTDKVDQWLSKSPSLSLSSQFSTIYQSDFQPTTADVEEQVTEAAD